MLSRASKLAGGHVGLIETGKRDEPSANTVSAIALVLGISSDWLVGGHGDAPDAEALVAVGAEIRERIKSEGDAGDEPAATGTEG